MTNTPVEALSAINVGVIKEEGRLEATITLEEFLRVAKSQHICAHTNARGEINFDLTISNTDNIIDKVKEWREQQEKKIEVAGVVLCSSDSRSYRAPAKVASSPRGRPLPFRRSGKWPRSDSDEGHMLPAS